ncbi:MAG: mannose-6-phosphate isomerase [Verrucomicrobiales bacterium]|jgi:mannose-6-phosphate isomerase
MERLVGVIKNYAWGSTTHLANLRGKASSARPESELWLGAHPATTAILPESDNIGLLQAIDDDPEVELGVDIADRFGKSLPYLLKLLAAGSPLSIQVHPSSEQAVVGFERENAAGVSLTSASRSFRDANHKPELIVALTPFEALVGFREDDELCAFIDDLSRPQLNRLREAVQRSGALGGLQFIMASDAEEIESTIASLTDVRSIARPDDAALIRRLAVSHAGDRGVLAAILLNRLVLQPGQGVYLGPGVLHAYVHGFGVEIMANCDNVLRCGLTEKPIDVDALLAIVDPDGRLPSIFDPAIGDVTEYVVPAPEFCLIRLHNVDGWMHEPSGPEILVGVEGTTTVRSGDRRYEIAPGDALWIRPSDGSYEVSGEALSFVATVGS